MLKPSTNSVLFSAVRVFCVHNKKTYYLYESERILEDGTTLNRNLKMSIQGKIKDKENFLQCARRIVKQKLGINSRVELNKTNLEKVTEDAEVREIQFFDLYLEPDMYNPDGYTYQDNEKQTFLKWKPVL